MMEADVVIANGTLLTMDAQMSVFKGGFIGVTGDRISHIGEEDPVPIRAKKVIDAQGGFVLPGLVNGHTHAPMTLFRGLADDLPLMEWLTEYIFPAESRMDKDFVRTGAMLACAEMILSGTTTFCDMYLFEDEVAEAAQETGMRCVVGEVLYDFPSPNYGPIEKGFEYTEFLIRKWSGNPLVSIAVEPHSLYTCNADLLTRANHLALTHAVPLVIHVAETKNEVQESLKKFAKRPFEYLESLGLLGPHIIADHCVHVNDSEIDTIARNQIKVVHNPESNMKLASGICPVSKLLTKGVTVGLGTDGCASNNNLDLLEEMDMAAKLQKVGTMDPTALDAPTVLRMATISGAKVLGLENLVGSLEVGKKADIILLDTRKPHLTPLYNPYSHLVYSARGNDVTHAIINGRLVLENRRFLSLDLEEVLGRAKEKAQKVLSWVSRS